VFTQRITPNPNISCKPGWCLEYVRRTFGQPAVPGYGTATAGWNNSKTQHRDRNFPAGVAVPVWYALANEPAGHVVLRLPDGSVYSTSDLGTVPHHHPDLADLERYYAKYGMTLTYRGWTEDIQGTPVITPVIITQKEWYEMALDAQTKKDINEAVWGGPGIPLIQNIELGRGEWAGTLLGAMTDRIVRQQIKPLRETVAAQNIQIEKLVGALAAVSTGQPFDQAKLLESIASAVKGALPTTVSFK
jgi:hypothetical protein